MTTPAPPAHLSHPAQAQQPSQSQQPQLPQLRRPASRTASASASTSASTSASSAPLASPPRSQRRRSSAAAGTATGTANVNRWSHSTASTTSPPDHAPHPSFSRKLSIPAAAPLSALHGDAPPSHSSHDPSLTLTLLPATVYDPHSPAATSTADSPSTAGLFTPSVFSSIPPHDYFSAKPPAPQNPTNRPQSRTRDRVLPRSPLGSPAIIGAHEPDARHSSIPRAARPPTASRTPTTATRETAQRQAQSAGHRRSASRDLPRSESKDRRSESREPRSDSRGHYRSDSRDHRRTESNASVKLDDVHHGTPPRTRERREKDKKTMLSRALQKANTAVLLDNAQNFEGAMEAYEDACKLLQQVMVRSTQDEDRRKLDAIRVTYTNRIEELRRLDPAYINGSSNGKSLPARPMSGESLDEQRSMLLEDDDEEDEPAIIQTATVTRIVNDPSLENHPRTESEPPQSYQLPLRMPAYGGARESVISTAIRDVQKNMQTSQFHLQPPPGRLAGTAAPSALEAPMDRSYMPPPLSPRRSKSPLMSATLEPKDQMRLLQPQQPTQSKHQRAHSNESTSWLDTIDESGGSSCSSSVHSLMIGGMSRKHTRNTSGATEAEFDAALDAAVEAAYDEGYEPFDTEGDSISVDPLVDPYRNTELDKERAREAEREEIIQAAKYRYKETQLQNETLPHVRESAELMFNEEAEEEERLLDEMTREYMLDGFDFDLQTKSSLPRQSDSSGFSGSTHNSISSHRTTGGTSLSTVAEVMHLSNPKSLPMHSPPRAPAPSSSLPALPAPSGALPSVPEMQTSQENDASEATPRPTTANKDAVSVRSRRLSGINAKTLKIETSLSQVPAAPHTEKPPVPEKDASLDAPLQPKSAAASTFSSTQTAVDPTFKIPALPQAAQQAGLAAPAQHSALYSPAETASPGTPALNYNTTNDSGLAPGSPMNGRSSTLGVRKNKSSLSLKQRNLSVSSPDGSDVSIGTPLSTSFSITGRKPSIAPAPLPTPSLPTFNVDGLPSGGMHLFESDIHSPFSPGSPSPAVANAPIPLEPCPETYLLRPFWLMRCFYQTIVHPRGGYLSTKLFIPRDVWRVKGVKLKNIEDKVANCDLLTAALQKLASVDTFDADAVLEEMQALELVLDQVQAQLAKKLGNEVGVQSVSTLFKDATTVGDGGSLGESLGRSLYSSQDHGAKGAVAQGKSYLSSWRKLRSKNSGVNLASMAGPKTGEIPKDSLSMATLPMTSIPTVKFAKRDMSGLTFEGPNSSYMSSLAKLFDAAQILDQIARQVEDPGLKHSSPTHVGMELSTRHAAEFFGFYICRFVLSDVTLMLDKFIKRGSEWVLV